MKIAQRILIATGTLLMGYAVLGAIFDIGPGLLGVLIFLSAVLVAHDAILLPAVIGVGALLGRLRAPARAPVRAAALISLAVSLVALPLLLGFGRSPDNPSILPLPYGRGLLLTLAAIWIPTLAIAAVRTRRAHGSTSPAPSDPPSRSTTASRP